MGGGEGSHRLVLLGLTEAFGCAARSRPEDQGGGPELGCGGKCWEQQKAGGDLVQEARGAIGLG